MAVVEISRRDLENLIGKKVNDDTIKNIIPMMGAPLERIEGDTLAYEIFPDRPDMLSVEGFAHAIRDFLGTGKIITKYKTEPSGITLSVDTSVSSVRPYISASVIRNVKMSNSLVASLMQVQEKIHETLGRKRRKVAIGVHNLDNVKPPFEYKAVKPHDISFVPLDMKKKMTLREICNKHPKGGYCSILQGNDNWPVIVDSNNDVLSFPPVINGELTRVTKSTKNVFIDVTGTDRLAVNQTINILCASFTERGSKIETVTVGGEKTPDMSFRKLKLNLDYLNKLLDLDLRPKQVDEELRKMGMYLKNGHVYVPPYRSDVMHEIDIVEDVSIAHGYMKFEPRIPRVPTIARRLEKNEYFEELRDIMVGLGFQEVVTMILTNEADEFRKMNNYTENVCETLNPVSRDHSICRKYLLPSLLRVFVANRNIEYPQKIFELGYCIIADDKEETGARNIAKLSAAVSNSEVNYDEISSVLDAFMRHINAKHSLKRLEHGSFVPGRCASIITKRNPVGIMGEIHPRVLNNWKLEKPVVALEINVDTFL